jgi:predicted site-specific integrase-resolvase
MEGDEEMLTTAQTMEELRISRATLYNWIKAGKLHPVPLNPKVRRPRVAFRRSEVDPLKLPEEQPPASE